VLPIAEITESGNVPEPATKQIGIIEQPGLAGGVSSSTIAKEPAIEEKSAENPTSVEESSIQERLTLEQPIPDEKITETPASEAEPCIEEPLAADEPMTISPQSEDLVLFENYVSSLLSAPHINPNQPILTSLLPSTKK